MLTYSVHASIVSCSSLSSLTTVYMLIAARQRCVVTNCRFGGLPEKRPMWRFGHFESNPLTWHQRVKGTAYGARTLIHKYPSSRLHKWYCKSLLAVRKIICMCEKRNSELFVLLIFMRKTLASQHIRNKNTINANFKTVSSKFYTVTLQFGSFPLLNQPPFSALRPEKYNPK
jgi:hypothetical protein